MAAFSTSSAKLAKAPPLPYFSLLIRMLRSAGEGASRYYHQSLETVEAVGARAVPARSAHNCEGSVRFIPRLLPMRLCCEPGVKMHSANHHLLETRCNFTARNYIAQQQDRRLPRRLLPSKPGVC